MKIKVTVSNEYHDGLLSTVVADLLASPSDSSDVTLVCSDGEVCMPLLVMALALPAAYRTLQLDPGALLLLPQHSRGELGAVLEPRIQPHEHESVLDNKLEMHEISQDDQSFKYEISREENQEYNQNEGLVDIAKDLKKENQEIIEQLDLNVEKSIVKEFICKLCALPRRFLSKWNLRRHMKSEHGRAGEIKLCKSVLLSDTEKDLIENKTADCNMCDTKFSCLENLQHHKIIQHGKEKYQCTECEQSFRRKNSKNIHVRRKHKGRKYQCELCSKLFSEKLTLKQHINSHINPVERKLKPLHELKRGQYLKRVKKERREINDIVNEAPEGKQKVCQ